MALINRCICGKMSYQDLKRHHMPMRICKACGVLHQVVSMTAKEYANFYTKEYHDSHQKKIGSQPYKERYDHDYKIAKLRFEKYSTFIPAKGKLLDIGSGNGAFVDYARDRGYDACGVDYVEHPWTYKGPLESVNFPTEHFDTIVMHDVLEHLINPVQTLKEIRRILKPGGQFIVDFPNYFVDAGRHHWRPIQHLWYFTEQQLLDLLKKEGFGIREVDFPIPGKFVVYTYSKDSAASNTKVLVLPGMGDIYWTMTRFQAVMRQRNITLPQTYIWNFDNRPRSKEFLAKFPFLKSAGYWNTAADPVVLNDTYVTNKKWLIENYKGFDYYLSVNGLLVCGEDLAKTSETNWYVPMFEPIEGKRYVEAFKKQHGDYVIAFFSDMGMFERWVKQLSAKDVYSLLSKVASATNCKVLLTGCEWDRPFNQELLELDSKNQFLDMIAKTSNDEFLAMMRGSRGMIGWCGGNTIMSAVFKKPTIVFWCEEHFKNSNFFKNSVPAESVNNWYFPVTTESYNERKVMETVIRSFI